MGERDFLSRYLDSRAYADEQARRLEQGQPTGTYRGLRGAAWIAEAYRIAASDARTLVWAEGPFWQPSVDECSRLAEQYDEQAKGL